VTPLGGEREPSSAQPHLPRHSGSFDAAPFGDPTTGASLFVFSSNQSGGCRLDVTLPAANWAMFEEIVLDLARKAGGLARTTRL
jgi:hypothetical protein